VPRPPIPEDKRLAILAELKTDKPRNQIAREHGVSPSSVTKIAQANGHQFDRALTKHATAAATIDHQARLVKLAATAAGLAERAALSFESMTDEQWAKMSPHSRAVLFGIASDKARDLASADSGVEQAITGLGKLFDGLVERHGDDDSE
jgi:transposase-like protein